MKWRTNFVKKWWLIISHLWLLCIIKHISLGNYLDWLESQSSRSRSHAYAIKKLKQIHILGAIDKVEASNFKDWSCHVYTYIHDLYVNPAFWLSPSLDIEISVFTYIHDLYLINFCYLYNTEYLVYYGYRRKNYQLKFLFLSLSRLKLFFFKIWNFLFKFRKKKRITLKHKQTSPFIF